MSVVEPRPVMAAWDELIGPGGVPHEAARALTEQITALGLEELQHRQDLADLDVLTMGITFTVYADGRGIDRAWPFDVVPRVIDAREWLTIERGLVQRLKALNRFIDDLYNERAVVADGVFPADVLAASPDYLPECRGMRPAFGVWAHICGSDLVRDSDGTVYVLEDNLRIPSGVGYMLENRMVAKRTFADLFRRQSIMPVDDYPDQLLRLLCSLAPPEAGPSPNAVVLTPGIYNSAYFEHSYLAQRMGIPLVEGGDLLVGPDRQVFMRTIGGQVPVHVIYRRVEDRFLDPDVWEPDSTLGCRGLMSAWRAGQVAIANAPGAGVADDKVVYAWVPELIRYYLGEQPILPNVQTYRCCYPEELSYVLAHAAELVLKPANESGGHGLTIGDRASRAELDRAIAAVKADPRGWVAQPILRLSTAPTLCDGRLAARHVDLRPFILSGQSTYVTKGGLTRVACARARWSSTPARVAAQRTPGSWNSTPGRQHRDGTAVQGGRGCVLGGQVPGTG
jgi:uncharacterized circularly permuted ATP-grasp superfamily protein